MENKRGDLAVGRTFSLKKQYSRALEQGIEFEKILTMAIQQEKEWCERSIFLAIRHHNIIDYEVKVDDNMEVSITARLHAALAKDTN